MYVIFSEFQYMCMWNIYIEIYVCLFRIPSTCDLIHYYSLTLIKTQREIFALYPLKIPNFKDNIKVENGVTRNGALRSVLFFRMLHWVPPK